MDRPPYRAVAGLVGAFGPGSDGRLTLQGVDWRRWHAASFCNALWTQAVTHRYDVWAAEQRPSDPVDRQNLWERAVAHVDQQLGDDLTGRVRR